jgi:hypothetical protein
MKKLFLILIILIPNAYAQSAPEPIIIVTPTATIVTCMPRGSVVYCW